LYLFLDKLKAPLGYKGKNFTKEKMVEFVGKMKLPTYDNITYFHFWDVITALSKHLFTNDKDSLKKIVINSRTY
jgi:hypothetical protein